jgi:ribosomal protein S18 acetylase RimI-like enzyme
MQGFKMRHAKVEAKNFANMTTVAPVATPRRARLAPKLRMAAETDMRMIATLMDLSSAGGMAFAWARIATKDQDWRDVAIEDMLALDGDLSLKNIILVEVGGQVAGMAVLNGLSDDFTCVDDDMLPAESRPLYAILKAAPGCLLVREIAVFPRFRGQGCGNALMVGAHAVAEGKGMPGMALNVHESNLGARKLYESHGFTPVSACPAVCHPAYAPTSMWITMKRMF